MKFSKVTASCDVNQRSCHIGILNPEDINIFQSYSALDTLYEIAPLWNRRIWNSYFHKVHQSVILFKSDQVKMVNDIYNFLLKEGNAAKALFICIKSGKKTAFINHMERSLQTQIHCVENHYELTTKIDELFVDYFLKPVDISNLKEAVSKTLNRLGRLVTKPINHSQKVVFPVLNGFRLEYISNISYLLADGSYTIVIFNQGSKLVVSKNLKHYELRLEQHGFIRIHPSVLINYEKIKEVNRSDGGYVIMEDGKTLPISKNKRKEFEGFIKQYNL
ncbi:LytR/AlgR family response regulator transcription factor [Aquimarina sp. M1]